MMKRKKITFMRHAQSTFNAYGDQSSDCGLSQSGANSASHIKGSFDLVIISPLKRVRETFQHSKIQSKNIMVNELCRERKESNCDFLNLEDKILESEDELKTRVEKFKIFLKNRMEDKILVISHHTFLYYLTGVYFANCQMLELYI